MISHPPQISTAQRTAGLEFEILLACAKTQLSPQHLERIAALVNEGPNWSALLKAAVQHRIVPLLNQGLDQACPDMIPEQIRQFLNRNCQINTLKNMFLENKLQDVLSWFQAEQVPVVAYKGPVLAKLAYPSLALRQFTDLDLLVRPQDFEQSRHILKRQGLTRCMDLGWEMHYVSADQQLNVDLHRSLVPEFFGFPDNFIDPTSDELSVEDWLILLAIQFGKDCCHWKVCLGQLVDIAALMTSHPEIDYGAVQKRAKSLGCSRFLGIVLILVQDLLHQEVPTELASQLVHRKKEQQLAQWVKDRMAAETEQPTVVPDDAGFWYFLVVYNHRFYLQVRERLRDKVYYCAHWGWKVVRMSLRPNHADRAILNLPQALDFLYVPIHIVRLMHKHVIKRAIATLTGQRGV